MRTQNSFFPRFLFLWQKVSYTTRLQNMSFNLNYHSSCLIHFSVQFAYYAAQYAKYDLAHSKFFLFQSWQKNRLLIPQKPPLKTYVTANLFSAGITIGSSQSPLTSMNTSPIVRATSNVVASTSMITVSDIRPSQSSANVFIQATPKSQCNCQFDFYIGCPKTP